MGALVDKMNAADRLAAYWRQGLVTAIAAQEILEGLGFTAIDFGQRSIVARLNGVRLDLDGSFYSHGMEAA